MASARAETAYAKPYGFTKFRGGESATTGLGHASDILSGGPPFSVNTANSSEVHFATAGEHHGKKLEVRVRLYEQVDRQFLPCLWEALAGTEQLHASQSAAAGLGWSPGARSSMVCGSMECPATAMVTKEEERERQGQGWQARTGVFAGEDAVWPYSAEGCSATKAAYEGTGAWAFVSWQGDSGNRRDEQLCGKNCSRQDPPGHEGERVRPDATAARPTGPAPAGGCTRRSQGDAPCCGQQSGSQEGAAQTSGGEMQLRASMERLPGPDPYDGAKSGGGAYCYHGGVCDKGGTVGASLAGGCLRPHSDGHRRAASHLRRGRGEGHRVHGGPDGRGGSVGGADTEGCGAGHSQRGRARRGPQQGSWTGFGRSHQGARPRTDAKTKGCPRRHFAPWQGLLTCLLDIRGPIQYVSHETWTTTPVHSIMSEEDFVSPFRARWNALQLQADLAFEELGLPFSPGEDTRLLNAEVSDEMWQWQPPDVEPVDVPMCSTKVVSCKPLRACGRSCLHRTRHPIPLRGPSFALEPNLTNRFARDLSVVMRCRPAAFCVHSQRPPDGLCLRDPDLAATRPLCQRGHEPCQDPVRLPTSACDPAPRPTIIKVMVAEALELLPETIKGPFKYAPIGTLPALSDAVDGDDDRRHFVVFDPVFHSRSRRRSPDWNVIECVADAVAASPLPNQNSPAHCAAPAWVADSTVYIVPCHCGQAAGCTSG